MEVFIYFCAFRNINEKLSEVQEIAQRFMSLNRSAGGGGRGGGGGGGRGGGGGEEELRRRRRRRPKEDKN